MNTLIVVMLIALSLSLVLPKDHKILLTLVQAIIFPVLTFYTCFIALMAICELHILPYSYCGEITGLANVGVTSIIVAALVLVNRLYRLSVLLLNRYKVVRKD